MTRAHIEVLRTELKDVLLFQPQKHKDERGYFLEIWENQRYGIPGMEDGFVQDNYSYSRKGVLRGLHFQEPEPQGKLVHVLVGIVYDVVVDVRKGSPTFGKWIAVELSSENNRQLWIPKGFAHGFYVLSESASFYYKCTNTYYPEYERTIRWDDPDLKIPWPTDSPIISPKDKAAPLLNGISTLPAWDPAT